MYERFFDLDRAPFAMVPDPDCVYLTGQHADVISGVVYGVLDRKGCLLLTGEAGLGKTTALRAVMELLNESNAHTSLIIHPTLEASEFLELALLNFGISPVPESKAQRLRLLEDFVQNAANAGRACALIVDEAHKLGPDALEEIRLLGNLESNGQKLLQIVLAGQNELVDRLNLPQLWQLKQRIAFRLQLNRLDREGVEHYVTFRWRKAGGGDLPFDQEALEGIAKWSHGIPRVINAICDNALLVAFSDTTRSVKLHEVEEACHDLDLPTPALRRVSSGAAVQPRPAAPTVAPRSSVPPVATVAAQEITPKAQTDPAPANPAVQQKPASSPLSQGTWGEERPSLLKRWLGLADNQEQNENLLSLKRHL